MNCLADECFSIELQQKIIDTWKSDEIQALAKKHADELKNFCGRKSDTIPADWLDVDFSAENEADGFVFEDFSKPVAEAVVKAVEKQGGLSDEDDTLLTADNVEFYLREVFEFDEALRPECKALILI